MFPKMTRRLDVFNNYFVTPQQRLSGNLSVLGAKNKVVEVFYYALFPFDVVMLFWLLVLCIETLLGISPLVAIILILTIVVFPKVYLLIISTLLFPTVYTLKRIYLRPVNNFLEVPRFNFNSGKVSIHQLVYIQKPQMNESMNNFVSEGLEDGINKLFNEGYRDFEFKTHKMLMILMLKRFGLSKLEIRKFLGCGLIEEFETEKFGLASIEIKELKRKSFVTEKALLSKKPNFRRKYPKYKVLVHFSRALKI